MMDELDEIRFIGVLNMGVCGEHRGWG